jgi:2',3'-cyclic-nucleotide 2'-phosphodiesterase (5'-nucleotidase family)
MTWKDVSVWQMQQIANVLAKTKDETELDISVKVLGILTNRTESQIDSLLLEDLRAGLNSIKFIHKEQPVPNTLKYIDVNGRRYKCIYDIKKLPYARYMETKHFGNDVMNNLHKIGASMVMPMKKTWLGWKVDKYDASKHEEYANDILEAKYESVYGSVVFFCQVYIHSISNLGDYLKNKF